MSLPTVDVLLQNGALGGVAAFAEGVCGIIGTGVAVSGKIQLNDPRVVFSLDEAEELGITEADNAAMYRQVKEFYDEGGKGKELYIQIVADTLTLTDMGDKSEANGIVKLLNYAQGRVRLWGAFFVPDGEYSDDTAAGVDADVLTALVTAQATCVEYAENHMPCRAIIEGRAFSGTAANLTDLHTMTNNRVGVLIGGTSDDGSASVGLLLGRLAKLPVQRRASRVKDGSVVATAIYIGDVEGKDYDQAGLIHDKGYITFRTYVGKSGYFFNRDWTAAPLSDDYSTISRGRVIDKASVIAYLTYLEELDDEVFVDDGGKMSQGAVSFLEKLIEGAIGTSMLPGGEITSVAAEIDPTQNITATDELVVALEVGSVAYNGTITVLLGFKAPTTA